MFTTNSSPDLYALTLCIMFRKNTLILPRLPGISPANLNENYRRYDFQAIANISGKYTTYRQHRGAVLRWGWGGKPQT